MQQFKMAQFIVDTSELKKVNKELKRMINDIPKLNESIRRRLGRRTKQLAKVYVNPKFQSTGNLKSSIIMRKESADTTLITAGAPYADFVELGTKAHKQRFAPGSKGDKLSKFWRTERSKQRHVAGSVRMHPGSKPMDFMGQAFRQINKEAEGLILKETNKYLSKRGFK